MMTRKHNDADKEHMAEHMKAQVEHMIDEGREKLEKEAKKVKQHVMQTGETVTGYIKENPFVALGAAAFVGVCLAWLFRK